MHDHEHLLNDVIEESFPHPEALRASPDEGEVIPIDVVEARDVFRCDDNVGGRIGRHELREVSGSRHIDPLKKKHLGPKKSTGADGG